MYERRNLFTHIKFYVLNKRSGQLIQMLWQAQAMLNGTATIVTKLYQLWYEHLPYTK